MCMMSRTIALVTMGLIYIARSGWIAWKHYVVALWGVYKGSPNLILAVYVFVVLRYPHGFEVLMYVTCNILLSLFVNVIALNQLLRAIGMYDLSQSRILNMDAAVILVNHCREKSIMSLKMDRVIADANWLVVDQTTKLPHPYSRILADIEASGNDQNAHARVITCMECNAESVAPLTKKELIDLTLEAKHRILKAQMMSFWKQSENGTLSGHGYRFLVNLVEMASVRDDPLLSLKALKIQREGSLTLRRLKAFFGYLYTITSTTHRFIPTNWLRALCFRICTSRAFQIMMACLCLIDLGLLINFLVVYYFQYENEIRSGRITKNNVYQLFDFIFFSIFFLEFMIYLLGIGVVQYFQSNVSKIDFATGVVIRPTELGMILDSYYRSEIVNLMLVDRCIIFTKTLLLLRFARIYIFIVALIPKMLNVVDRRMDDDLIKAYDIGKAYIIALDKVIKFLGYIVDNEIVFSYLTEYMENERRIVTKELGLIQKDRPTIAITIKTRHAVRHVINTMNDCVDDMKEEGMLDWSENQTLKSALLKVKKRIRNLILISPSPPDWIIKEVPWLFGDHETCNFFSEHAMLSSYAQKDIIIYHGDEPYGLYILVSGLVRSYYKPSDTTTFLAKTFGVLPNYDFFMNHLKLDTPQEEFIIGGGNVIGEIGVITGRKYDMTVVCETSCQVYYIPWKIIQAVVHDSSNAPVIKSRIWKAVAIKIGVNLLPYTPRFQGWSREKLLLYLQRGVVPVLDNVTIVNINNEIIEDLLLVEGMGMDMATRSIFYGPMMIPRTIQKLLLPNSPLWDYPTDYQTHLLVIPCTHAYVEDMMGPEGLFKGNYKEVESNEKGEHEEEGAEEDDDEGEEDDDDEDVEEVKELKDKKEEKGVKEIEKVDENTSKSKKSCQHKQKLTPEMLLKLRRKKRSKRITFLDYIPTLAGPLEGNIASTTFIIKSKRDKEVRTMHNRNNNVDSSIKYTQDIEESSEIGSAKDEDAEVSQTSTKQKTKKSKSYSFGDRFSTHSGLSQIVRKASDVPKKIELMVIESESDIDESLNEKEMQTSLRINKNHRTMKRFLRGIKTTSREIDDPSLASSSGNIM
uniref:Cyclic nucleotide-binding domain-containing protein n=1 Tax=Lygus hesperus TaxID=30085 RepID=A0A0K8S6J0_LYGHE